VRLCLADACAPDGLRDVLRSMTRMQLIRTLAAWRPDLTAYRDVEAAYRITFKSLARRYLELHDEIADLDIMIGAIVDELAPDLVSRNSIGHIGAAQLLLAAGDNPDRLQKRGKSSPLIRLTCFTRSLTSVRRSRQTRRRSSSCGVGALAMEHTRGSPRLKAIRVRTRVSPSIRSVFARRPRRAESGSRRRQPRDSRSLRPPAPGGSRSRPGRPPE
jgi:transposase